MKHINQEDISLEQAKVTWANKDSLSKLRWLEIYLLRKDDGLAQTLDCRLSDFLMLVGGLRKD